MIPRLHSFPDMHNVYYRKRSGDIDDVKKWLGCVKISLRVTISPVHQVIADSVQGKGLMMIASTAVEMSKPICLFAVPHPVALKVPASLGARLVNAAEAALVQMRARRHSHPVNHQLRLLTGFRKARAAEEKLFLEGAVVAK